MFDIKDDYWDIEKLLPKKKNTVSPFSTKEKTVEYTVRGEEKTSSEKNKLTLPDSKGNIQTETYSLENGFIRKVTITRFTDKYDFYGNFRKAALVYYDFKTPKCEFAPFYSYMPQYSQLNSQQKNFYFFWRDCVRRKKYIKTDYSYFYLYVYEILNLPDKIPAEEGLEVLIELWRAYRKELPNIDGYMALLIQDFCLVYKLTCPMKRISDFIFDIVGASEFKEFYLADVRAMGDVGISIMIAYLSDYDWRKGRYAGGDNREVYSKHLIGAMEVLINKLWDNGDIANSTANMAHVSRNAFRNSLCTHSVKCRLDIEYVPVSTSEKIRRSVTAALKYTENKLRALVGAKSRLAVKDLPCEYKDIIDSYFNEIFDRVNRERKRTSVPEYEKLYDAESTEMSFEGADEIERLSWTTTARLVSEEEHIPYIEQCTEDKTECDEAVSDYSADTYGLSALEMDFVKAVLNSDNQKISMITENIGAVPEAIAEKVNEAFCDGFGDVIIEGEWPELNIIEDYKEDIEKWLSKITK